MRSSFLLPTTGNIWSTDHIQTLRRLVQEGRSVKDIALAMKRTESAIRNKAVMHGISLRVVRKSAGPAVSMKQQEAQLAAASAFMTQPIAGTGMHRRSHVEWQ